MRKGIVALAVLLWLAGPSAAADQALVNRRDQARGSFLASPAGIYRHYCAHCHGENGKGDGTLWAPELTPPPADLTGLEADKRTLVRAIREGSAAAGKSNLCPPWGRTLSQRSIERLARYLSSLAGEMTAAAAPAASGVEREPVPWLLLALVLAEMAVLWRLVSREERRRKG